MPVTPGAAGASFDVFLAFSLDEEANKRVQARVTTIEQELKRIQEEAAGAGKAINTAMQSAEKKADTAQKSVAKVGAEMTKMGERAKQSSAQVDQAVSKTVKKYQELEKAAKNARQQAERISSTASRAGSIFGQGLVAGGAVVGGIVAEAGRYASEEQNANRATAATLEWAKATDQLARARARVDNVLLRESLPLLQEAAKVANQAAGFIERNPEIVRAALNTGLVVAGLSAVGLAVTKGIKLVADVAYIAATVTELTAAKLQEKAAKDQLAAAVLQNKAPITNRADDLRKALLGGGTLSKLGLLTSTGGATGLGVGLSVALGAAIGAAINDAVTKITGKGAYTNQFLTVGARGFGQAIEPLAQRLFGISPEEAQRKTLVFTALIGKLTGAIDENSPLWQKAANSIKNAGQTVSDVVAQLAGSANEQAIVGAWEKWQKDDAQIVSDAARKREQIITDAEKAITTATQRLNSERTRINQQADSAYTKLMNDFAAQSKKDEDDYRKQRLEIAKSGNEEIRKIEEDHQEAERQKLLDHNQRVDDLVASRDALALDKENARFDRERLESDRQTNKEIAARRQDIARRLEDLAEQYKAEREQKRQQFQDALKANEDQRQAELQQAQDAYQAELKAAREAKAQQLHELEASLKEERMKRREEFIGEVRDLDAALLGERELRKSYYQKMTADAEAWLADYRSKLPGGSTQATGFTGSAGVAPGHDYSGYAYPGLYRMAINGQREFVMGGDATRAAERIIGGQLTQDNLLRSLASLGARRSGDYIDQRRIDRPLSKDDLALYKQGAIDALEEIML